MNTLEFMANTYIKDMPSSGNSTVDEYRADFIRHLAKTNPKMIAKLSYVDRYNWENQQSRQAEYQKGCQQGRQEGYRQGRQEGYKEGCQHGRKEGYRQGQQKGYRQGHQKGYQQGCRQEFNAICARAAMPWRVKIVNKTRYAITIAFNGMRGTFAVIPSGVFNKNFMYDGDEFHAVMKNRAGHDAMGAWLAKNGFFQK